MAADGSLFDDIVYSWSFYASLTEKGRKITTSLPFQWVNAEKFRQWTLHLLESWIECKSLTQWVVEIWVGAASCKLSEESSRKRKSRVRWEMFWRSSRSKLFKVARSHLNLFTLDKQQKIEQLRDLPAMYMNPFILKQWKSFLLSSSISM